jgi:nitrogen fixation protein FixH
MKELTGRHVLYMLFAFFGVIFIANIILVYKAVSTFNGAEANAYSQGIHYNERIAFQKRQNALQWTHKVEFGENDIVQVKFTDKANAPVAGLTLSGDIGRPASSRFTQQLAFKESTPGVYTASPEALKHGVWVVSLNASKGQEQSGKPVYRLKEPLCLRCPQWSHKVEFGDNDIIRVTFTDKANAPVAGLKLSGDIGRPDSSRFTQQLAFNESSPGVYTASPNTLEHGVWIVSLAASKGQGQNRLPLHRLKERLCLRCFQ